MSTDSLSTEPSLPFQKLPPSSYSNIPTPSIYTQEESKYIFIHRDTLFRHISNFLQHYIEIGTTISLFIATISVVINAISYLCKDDRDTECIVMLLVNAISGAVLATFTIFSIARHYQHWGKTIDTLMRSIEKECPRKTEG